MLKAIIWMSGALASLCLMAVGARELSGQVSTFQILFFRSVIGLLIIFPVIFFSKQKGLLRTSRIKLHSVRNVVHFAGQYGWFLGIGLLPMAEVIALEFTVPLWTVLIACAFLGESFTARKVGAVVLGLVGVFIIVRPGVDVVQLASLIVLASALCYAIVHAATKSLSATESPLTVLFFMCAIQLPLGFGFSLFNWQTPQGMQWFWLAVVGTTAVVGHYCITKAMQHAEVTAVVTMDFLRLPAVGVIGILVYAEAFEVALLIGTLFMLSGNLLGLYVPKRTASLS